MTENPTMGNDQYVNEQNMWCNWPNWWINLIWLIGWARDWRWSSWVLGKRCQINLPLQFDNHLRQRSNILGRERFCVGDVFGWKPRQKEQHSSSTHGQQLPMIISYLIYLSIYSMTTNIPLYVDNPCLHPMLSYNLSYIWMWRLED